MKPEKARKISQKLPLVKPHKPIAIAPAMPTLQAIVMD